MMTVHEVSKISGLSVRTLHHYDKIGLFRPSSHSEAGYRLYDDASLERLLFIMLYRTLGFPLEEIKAIMESKHYDRNAALRQQIEMLTLKKEWNANKSYRIFGTFNPYEELVWFDIEDAAVIDEEIENERNKAISG